MSFAIPTSLSAVSKLCSKYKKKHNNLIHFEDKEKAVNDNSNATQTDNKRLCIAILSSLSANSNLGATKYVLLSTWLKQPDTLSTNLKIFTSKPGLTISCNNSVLFLTFYDSYTLSNSH